MVSFFLKKHIIFFWFLNSYFNLKVESLLYVTPLTTDNYIFLSWFETNGNSFMISSFDKLKTGCHFYDVEYILVENFVSNPIFIHWFIRNKKIFPRIFYFVALNRHFKLRKFRDRDFAFFLEALRNTNLKAFLKSISTILTKRFFLKPQILKILNQIWFMRKQIPDWLLKDRYKIILNGAVLVNHNLNQIKIFIKKSTISICNEETFLSKVQKFFELCL